MALRRIDVTGQKFGRLSVVCDAPNGKSGRRISCVCDCGKSVTCNLRDLMGGKQKSCGCWNREELRLIAIARATHRACRTSEYYIWAGLKARCLNPKARSYPHYGGRGIKVCDRWLDSFETFLADMGKKPFKTASIDRIDVNGDYTPDNCRWASLKRQARNRQFHLRVEHDGRTMLLIEACELAGINYKTAKYRVYGGRSWNAT